MTQDVSLATSYDFSRWTHFSRILQLACLTLQMFLIYTDFSNLSYFQIIVYEILCAGSFYIVFNRWHTAVDGRFDLEQLIAAKDVQRKLPYAVALFSAVLIGFLIWSFVELSNGFVNFIFHLAGAVNFFSALGLLGLEIYEVFVLKNKTK